MTQTGPAEVCLWDCYTDAGKEKSHSKQQSDSTVHALDQ